MNRWHPPNCGYTHEPPPVGSIVAYEHRAVEVIRYDQRDNGKTTVHVRRLYGPKIEGENSRAECGLSYSGRPMWSVYRGLRVPLCSCCGEPWPCTVESDERDARDEMRAMADHLAKAGDGQCYSCGEHITRRQASTTAPEPNIQLPGFPPPAFHLRQACRAGLVDYERLRRASLKGDWSPLLVESEGLPL